MNWDDTYTVKAEHVWQEHFFEMVVACVSSDGGDGCAHIESEDYKELAEEFDKWRKTKPGLKDFLFRDDLENQVLFSDHSNENYLFCHPSISRSHPYLGDYVFTVSKNKKQ